MSDTFVALDPAPRLDIALRTAQRGLSCWTRAWAEATQGMVTASIAHAELMRSLMPVGSALWSAPFQLTKSRDAAAPEPNTEEAGHAWLKTMRTQFATGIEGTRKINDELAARLFAAAEGLVDGLAYPEEPDAADPPRS